MTATQHSTAKPDQGRCPYSGTPDGVGPETLVRETRLPRAAMIRDAARYGLNYRHGWLDRIAGHDFTRFRTGNRAVVSIGNPELIDQVLHEDRQSYYKSFEYELLRALLGVSLFTDEEDSWERHRLMLSPMFGKRHLNGLVDLMIEPIDALCDALAAEPNQERFEVEMGDEMVKLTLNVVGNSLFSKGFGPIAESIAPQVTGGLRFAERSIRVFFIYSPTPKVWRGLARVAFTPLPLPPPFWTIQQTVKHLDNAVWGVINDRRAHPIDSPDLLNHLLNASDDEGSLTLKRVRDESLTFMLAGHETTANALTWMWYLLSINPKARQRVYDEVDSVLQGRTPTADDLADLPYTTGAFLEAMRYFSPAWLIPRRAIRDTSIGGHRIKKGTTVIIPVHQVHHDPRWWPNPQEYDPSRFLPGAGKGRPRSAYLPFGGGRRICIGQGFATMESVLITAMLAQRYVFDLVPDHPVEPEGTLTLRPKHGMKMVARRRTEVIR